MRGKIAALLSAAMLVGIASGRGEDPVPPPFAPGETLNYEVSWSIFRAGEVVAKLSKAAGDAPDAYEIKTSARSQGFASVLFRVQNEFRSLFDPQSRCSRRIFKKVNEGRRKKETKIVFDPERRLAILDERDLTKPDSPPKHAENEIPACVQDIVSAFYFLRQEPLEVGQKILVPVNDGAKTRQVLVEVQARERIKTPLGARLALRVEPKPFDGLYKRKGRMLIWFSDDPQRLPLRIKATISVGAITGNLKSVTSETAVASSTMP